ncbi:MAG TPA: MMPL family transporter [Phycisphaerae bacterium]|nr:MMPL family transporter [Phycisphaerae bacterium]
MSIGSSIVDRSVRHYKAVTAGVAAVTLVVALAAGLPTVFPQALSFLHPAEVDTDPENMLSEDEPVRVFHNAMKRKLDLHDIVVVGVVNEQDPCGAFNVSTLRKVYELAEFAKGLHGERIGQPAGSGEGVIEADLIALSTVDSIEPTTGGVSFSWLMPEPPADANAAMEVWRKARRIPFLFGTIISDKQPAKPSKAVGLYLPLTRKDLSHRVYVQLQEKVASLGGPEQYHITGLPVAEDTFGVEMFVQMAISAPAAMLVIFLLMLAFFRKLVLILSPMLVALASVILTMGLLVIAGFPVHIMSSMIPIFIMPIAVLDSIHIISEFFERYQATRDRAKTIRTVMDELFLPMLYTSLTSAAGFASLALTPIPPVQIFGVFVAMGIMAAWALTVTLIPAYVMFISPRTLENFGARHVDGEQAADRTLLGRFLHWLAGMTYRRAKAILVVTLFVLAVAGYGISRINVNDNPVKWFSASHPIRVADRVLNRHFGGTYMAFLALEAETEPFDANALAGEVRRRAAGRLSAAAKDAGAAPDALAFRAELDRLARAVDHALAGRPSSREGMLQAINKALATPAAPARTPAPAAGARPGGGDEPALPIDQTNEPALPATEGDGPALPIDQTGQAPGPSTAPALDRAAREAVSLLLDEIRQEAEVFKRPDVLEWMVRLQKHAEDTGIVGKTNSLADIVRTVHRDFVSGRPSDYRVPDSRAAVGQMLIQYQSSHRFRDLWHFVTPDYRISSVWMQLTSGDNRAMQLVVAAADAFVAANPPPAPLKHRWFGLTYINVEWQNRMVFGMLEAFSGSFLVVFLLMTILFRSPLWGLLSMVPLTVTIVAIYGVVGLVGKDYDMPVAVLSSLTLGLAVDFSIHFLARSRAMYHVGETTWHATLPSVFGEPARAIARNIIVIAAGFLPLLLAPLVPYRTVGVLMATILLVSGVATLLLLPALVRVLEKRLFTTGQPMAASCNCGLCIVSAITLLAILAMAVKPYVPWRWTTLTWIGVGLVPVAAAVCGLASRRQKCKLQQQQTQGDES